MDYGDLMVGFVLVVCVFVIKRESGGRGDRPRVPCLLCRVNEVDKKRKCLNIRKQFKTSSGPVVRVVVVVVVVGYLLFSVACFSRGISRCISFFSPSNRSCSFPIIFYGLDLGACLSFFVYFMELHITAQSVH